MDDIALLRRYVENQSEEAFAELVQRHVNLVYSAALRQVGGDAHRAQDVAQVVFVDLARKAPSLRRHSALAGWLYTSTHYTAAKMVRAESRRQIREQELQAMNELLANPEPAVDWNQLRPVLDEAMHELSKGERDAVVLRFFDQRRMTEIGEKLGVTESAARKRMDRALENLRTLLAKRGVSSTTAALALALEHQSVLAAPAGMAAALTGSALAGAGGAAGAGNIATTLQLMSMTKLQIGFLGVLAASSLGLLALSVTSASKPSAEAIEATRPTQGAPTSTGRATVDVAAKATSDASAYNADLATFVANLRATGRSERLIRAIINAALNEQFRAQEEALLPPREPKNWWQYENPRVPPDKSMALLDLKREKAALRQQLLGPDPDALDADEQDNPIAPEKRELVKLIDEDYNLMIGSVWGLSGSLLLPAERAQIEFLKQERTRDYGILNPEELIAWRLRTSQFAKAVATRLRFFEPTDKEFEMLYEHERDLNDPAGTANRAEFEVAERAAMGEARFAEYDRSRMYEFQNLQELVIRAGLSRDVVIPVYDLWKAVTPESERIAADATLNQEEKIAALKQLSGRTRTGIQQALGPEVSAAYLRGANAWLAELERGYVVAVSDSGWSSRPVSIPRRSTPIPPRARP